jgi:hypothetical protein
MGEKENPGGVNGDLTDSRTDVRHRVSGVRWDDRRRRPGERRARQERRDDQDRRQSERRLRVADRRVIDGPFPPPDRRKGADRRKNDERRCQQRRGEERRKTPDRRKQAEPVSTSALGGGPSPGCPSPETEGRD